MKSIKVQSLLIFAALAAHEDGWAQAQQKAMAAKGTELGNGTDGLIDFRNPQPYQRFREPVVYTKIFCTVPKLKNSYVSDDYNRGREYRHRAILNGEDEKGFASEAEAFAFLVVKTQAALQCTESKTYPQTMAELPQKLEALPESPLANSKTGREFVLSVETLEAGKMQILINSRGLIVGSAEQEPEKRILRKLDSILAALRPANARESWVAPLTDGRRSATVIDSKLNALKELTTFDENFSRAGRQATLSYMTMVDLKAAVAGPKFKLALSFGKPMIGYYLTTRPLSSYEVVGWAGSPIEADTTAEGDRFMERVNEWVSTRIPTGLGATNDLRSIAQGLLQKEAFETSFDQLLTNVIEPLLNEQEQNPYLRAVGQELVKFAGSLSESRAQLGLPAKIYKPNKADELWTQPQWTYSSAVRSTRTLLIKRKSDSELSLLLSIDEDRHSRATGLLALISDPQTVIVEGLSSLSWYRDRDELLGIQAAVTNGMRILNRVWPGDPARLGNEGCNAIPGIARSIGQYKRYYFDPIASVALDADYSRSAYVEQVLTVLDSINQVSYKGESARDFLNKTLPDWEKVCAAKLGDIEAELKKFE
jgi:hypothetical protein